MRTHSIAVAPHCTRLTDAALRAHIPNTMPALRYALRTRRVTYVLDDEGVCKRVIVAEGAPRGRAEACVGAQFVACLDMATRGGLVGDMRVGAAALFVRPDASGRAVLLRTTTVRGIELLGALQGGATTDTRTTRTRELTSIYDVATENEPANTADLPRLARKAGPLPAYPPPLPSRKSRGG